MDTSTAIIITQVPIAIAILIGVIEIRKTRKELTRILNKIGKKKK